MTQEEGDFSGDDTGVSCWDHLPTASSKKSTFQHKHHAKSASTSSIRRRIPQADMPKLANLDQLPLHAPSQFVGTPFATDSKKFEYPFPEESSSCSASASSSSYTTPAILTPPLSSGSTFPFISASASSAQLTFPSLIQPGDSSSSSSSSTSSTSSFTPIHPRLKPPTNPPIPPSLVKKRPRWSLNMGRKRSGYDGHAGGDLFDGDDSMNLIESFSRCDLGNGVIPPHSQRDEFSRNDH